ncbi:rhotekin-like isoform X2 [Narcine bancroftii]|uniref:rhotekin-like isoform X2 n=1 Tax=Narcine bancroftii TaxID=1343680 RepID=UPI003831BCF5
MDESLRIMEDLNLLYIRQMARSLQDSDFQKKIDYEIRMRDGACKLLAACSQRDQMLEAAKSLMVCNARIISYMSKVQRMKEAQVKQRQARRSSDAGLLEDRQPCKASVSISELRIPLIWKDTDYFKNKGGSPHYAVFGLMQIGCDIYDTEMVLVDQTMIDICFESAVVFAPRKLASKLSSSLGRSSGWKVRAGLDVAGESPAFNEATSPISLPTSTVRGPEYHLLAHTSLSLADVHSGFGTHSLRVVGNEEFSFWLPLYGSLCCRLAAQPCCMTQPVITSFLNLQQAAGELHPWARMYCVLQGTKLLCYNCAEGEEAKVEPAFTIAINKETRIKATGKEPMGISRCISITNQVGGKEVTHMVGTDSPEQTHSWMEAFWQHFDDITAWKQCCDEVMKVETASPRKLPVTTSKKGASLYQETVIDSPDDIKPEVASASPQVETEAGHRGGTLPSLYTLSENSQKRLCSPPTPVDGHGASDGHDLCMSWIQSHAFDKNWNSQDLLKAAGEPHFSRPRTHSLDAKLMRLKCQAHRTEALSKARVIPLCTSSTQTSSRDSSPEAKVKAVLQPASEQRCKAHTSHRQQTQV